MNLRIAEAGGQAVGRHVLVLNVFEELKAWGGRSLYPVDGEGAGGWLAQPSQLAVERLQLPG